MPAYKEREKPKDIMSYWGRTWISLRLFILSNIIALITGAAIVLKVIANG